MVASHPMIELDRLFRFYGDTRAVDDVSFSVAAGEVFGYIGPNGAGKTTSMRVLATLDQPTWGDARIDGFSAVDDPDRVRRRLGFMPDAFGTYPYMNCEEYLDFFARAYELRGIERRKAVERTMKFTGVDALARKPITGLSKGMKQRLCLGRSMIHDPSVLVLDEPAAGLDPRARIELRRMIRDLADDGKAILISSHILTELAEMCDRVGIIERGQLLAVGTVDEILHGEQPRSEVRVRLIGPAAPLAEWLSTRDDLTDVHAEGETLHFTHAADREAEADLLRDMIAAGFRVVQFGGHVKSLEEVFMHVTKGIVQ
jgi:ABC-2 type transport system ATP-binding protein